MVVKGNLVRVLVLVFIPLIAIMYLLGFLTQADAQGNDLIFPSIQNANVETSEPDQWFFVLEDNKNQYARDVIQTNDGNFVFVGHVETSIIDEDGNPDRDGWIAKYSVNGDVIWQKHVGTENSDFISSVLETSTGDLVIVGTTYYDGWIVKLDANGNVIWQVNHMASSYSDIAETDDGGFIVTGHSRGTTIQDNITVVKMDNSGLVEWQRTYGVGGGYSIIQTGDLGYVVNAGKLIKLNSAGIIQWQKMGSYALSIIELSDNTLMAAGRRGDDAWLAKIGSDGSVIWQKIYTGFGRSSFNSIQHSGDGGFVLAGNYSKDYTFKALVMKVNNSGEPLWQNGTNIGSYEESFYAIESTDDGGYVAVGTIYNYDTEVIDIWLTKLDETGIVKRCPVIKPLTATAQVIEFPFVDAELDTALSTPITRTFPITVTDVMLPSRELCPLPPVTISKSGPEYAIGGCPFTYTLTITNNMSSDVTGIVVTDSVPINADYVGGGSFLSNNVSWTMPILLPGETTTQQFAVKATKSITNSDYRVSTNEGYSTTGQIAVMTTITNLNFLPVVLNNYCGSFFDTFSNPNSGWKIGDNDYVRSEYLNGEYRILTKQSGYVYVFSAPSCAREYYASAVDVRWAENRGAEYGLLMGINSNFDEYYMFLVSADYQDYGLVKRTPGGWQTIVAFTPNGNIHAGNNSNHLEATYVDGNMTLSVNGTLLGTWFVGYANAPTWTGIVAHPYDDVATADARFDNFSVETRSSLLQLNTATILGENNNQNGVPTRQTIDEWSRH